MKTALVYVGAAVVIGLSGYGAWRVASDLLTASHGQQAVETVSPFVKGAASAVGEKVKEAVKETPDATLERDAEDMSRKLYPLAKGALKGSLEAIIKDANRQEVPEKMRRAGGDVADKVVKPFAEGLVDGSGRVLDEVNRGLNGARKFREQNKDIIDSIALGLQALDKAVKDNPGLRPPLPPLPGLAPPPLPTPSRPEGPAVPYQTPLPDQDR